MKELSMNQWSKIMTIKTVESMANQLLQESGYSIEGESMMAEVNDDPYGLVEGQWTNEEKAWWGYQDRPGISMSLMEMEVGWE